jgi:hypothetical protein
LPPAARGPIGAALGRAERAYWLEGLRAANPGQRLRARFEPDGVVVASGPGRLRLSLAAYGRRGALQPAGAALPRVRANRVTYRHVALRERERAARARARFRPDARTDRRQWAATFALALSGNLSARMRHRAVVFSDDRASMRYGGLIATDARGRALRSWLGLSGGRLLVRVDDRGARYPVHVDPFIDQAELTAGDGGPEDNLGQSVAVSGDTVVVGAPYHTVGGHLEQGAVYVFVKPAAGWAGGSGPIAELTAGDGAAYDGLGWSVGVSGDTIVAGAFDHQVGSNQTQGAAYVFVRPGAGWASTSAPTAELTAGNGAAADDLGYAVAIAGDTIVVGAPQHKSGTIVNHVRQGAAYVFLKPPGGWANTSTPAAELTASDGAEGDNLGSSVALSGEIVVSRSISALASRSPSRSGRPGGRSAAGA